MLTPRTVSAKFAPSYISTGDLPGALLVQQLADEAYAQFKSNSDENSQLFPALARVPSELFGICIASTEGAGYGAGDTDFISVSKPFVLTLVSKLIGAKATGDKLGANAAEFPSNSLDAVEGMTHTRLGCRERVAKKDVRPLWNRTNGGKG
jgi:glutaminase